MSAAGFDFAAHMEPVARALLGNPTEVCNDGREWRYGARGSLVVQVRGPKQGLWRDHEADEGGGVLDLIRREKGFANGAALDWLRDTIGADIPERGRGRPSKEEFVERLARHMKPVAGTQAETYLREARGLSGPFPADLGYHPLVWHKEARGELPALLCLARNEAGEVAFVHAVYLDAGRKAAIEPVKKSFNTMAGAAVRFPATDAATDAAAGAKVVLAEGPEDALSVWQATGLEVWACCGISNIGKAPVPAGTTVIVAGQNDPSDKIAVNTLRKAVGRLRGRGFKVILAHPPAAMKDWNDLLRDVGAEAVRDAIGEAERRSGWRDDLDYGPTGEVRPILLNAVLALSHDDEWHGVLGFNEFSASTYMLRPGPWEVSRRGFVAREWTDLDDLCAAEWLQRKGIYVPPAIAGQAVQRVAATAPFHPVRDWLSSLKWDGKPRLDGWLTTYLGAADTAYTRAVGARWLISAVARIYTPGAKADCCLILEGPQGLKKSTALNTLAGDAWFTDQMPDLGSKDSMVQVQGKWIIELAELDSLNRGEVSRIKAFMSTRIDDFRVPYGRRNGKFPRQCVFAGSVNDSEYLKDETGGRRFWPVKCGDAIDVAGLQRDRAQLWAEAVVRFQAGATWWLDTRELNEAAAGEQAARYQGDPWDEAVTGYIAGSAEVTVSEILQNAIGMSKDKWTKREANRVGAILRSLGWTKRRAGLPDPVSGKRPPVFVPPSPSPPPQKDGDGDGDAIKPDDFNGMSPASPTSPSSLRTCGEKGEKSGAGDFPKESPMGYGGDGDVGEVGDISLKPNGKGTSPSTSPSPGHGDAAGLGDADALERDLRRLREMGFAAPRPDGDANARPEGDAAPAAEALVFGEVRI